MFICKVCNKSFYDLRPHLKKHKMTWQSYQDLYNENPTLQLIYHLPKEERLSKEYRYDRLDRIPNKYLYS